MTKTSIEQLCELYGQIDRCEDCELGGLRTNHAPRLRFKFGTKSILVVGQNPGRRVVPGCNHMWGGLDLLRKRTKDQLRLRRLDEVLDAVWITNVVKCRTDKNGSVGVDEISACEKWLRQEIRCIRPQGIIALGKPAHRWLSRNKKHHIQLCHPAYAARRGHKAVDSYIDSLHNHVFQKDAAILSKH